MTGNDDLKGIIEDFMQNSSPEEMKELERLLEARRNSTSGLNLNSMAKDMADQIQNQMGLTNQNIKKMARELVIKLAREHSPQITDTELRVLLNQMVPNSEPEKPKLPPDLLKIMAHQFIIYHKGLMSDEEKADLPPGWQEKYWSAFPDELKRMISEHISSK